ncbi:MAG: hypothetical protein V4487_00205 [Chlamydiota bacterium]
MRISNSPSLSTISIFQEGAPSSWKKFTEIITAVALAAISYFVLGWIGLIGALAIYGIAKLLTKAPDTKPLKAPFFVSQQNYSGNLLTGELLVLNKALLQEHPPQFTNHNKAHAYAELTAGRGLVENEIRVEKFSAPRSFEKIRKTPLFSGDAPVVLAQPGTFFYPPGEHHWTANFGDQNVFFGCLGPLLAQDEQQVLEHPALSHFYSLIKKNEQHMNIRPFVHLSASGDALLIEGAKRYGELDTSTPIEGLGNIYGNHFARASEAQINQALLRFEQIQESKLFVFCAPNISANLEGQPYQEDTLRELFLSAFTAFKAIGHKDPNAIIHTGNWGCGAFGNDPKTVALLQLAAAHFSGIRRLEYYPLGHAPALASAQGLLAQIQQNNPAMTVEGFLHHLTLNAAQYGLRYGRGNGT